MIGKKLHLLEILGHEGCVVGGLYANVEVFIYRQAQQQASVPSYEQLKAHLAYENSLLGENVNLCTPEILLEALEKPNIHLGASEDAYGITATCMLSFAQKPNNGLSPSVNPAVSFYSGLQKHFGEAFAIAFPPEAMIRQVLTDNFGHLVHPKVLEDIILTWVWQVRGIDLS